METREIDLKGKVCPSTLLAALRELNGNRDALRSGELKLVFTVSNRDATITIPASAVNMGYEADVTGSDGCYTIEIYNDIK